MRSAPVVANIIFHPAARELRAGGLLGWVSLELDTLRIDGITVRRTADGTPTLSFPEKTDRYGTRHPIARPLNAASRATIEEQVFAYLRKRGWL